MTGERGKAEARLKRMHCARHPKERMRLKSEVVHRLPHEYQGEAVYVCLECIRLWREVYRRATGKHTPLP